MSSLAPSASASRSSGTEAPLIFVGGGLANGLIGYRLKMLQPERRMLVLERGPTLGGNHTWSFHQTDVPPETLEWLQPFIVRRWPGQTVRFHGRERSFGTPYCSITSERLHELVTAALGDAARTGADVRRIAADHVELADGTIIQASGVIDGRGARAAAAARARLAEIPRAGDRDN